MAAPLLEQCELNPGKGALRTAAAFPGEYCSGDAQAGGIRSRLLVVPRQHCGFISAASVSARNIFI